MVELSRRMASRGAVLVVTLASLACEGDRPPPPAAPGTVLGKETAPLVETLVRAGYTLETSRYRPVPADYLRAPVAAYVVNDESLAIWEYPSPEAAADDGARVSPRGIDGGFHELGTAAQWFRRGRLLVLYVGTDERLRRLLIEALGPAFARGDTE